MGAETARLKYQNKQTEIEEEDPDAFKHLTKTESLEILRDIKRLPDFKQDIVAFRQVLKKARKAEQRRLKLFKYFEPYVKETELLGQKVKLYEISDFDHMNFEEIAVSWDTVYREYMSLTHDNVVARIETVMKEKWQPRKRPPGCEAPKPEPELQKQ
jgi:acyl-ACP thioesterase